jgi:hypothetical protein
VFNPLRLHVKFLVEEVTQKQVFLTVFWGFPSNDDSAIVPYPSVTAPEQAAQYHILVL